MAEIALVGIFAGLPDRRRKQGRRHSLPLCLALFTLAVAAGNQGFLAIGDWLKSYQQPFYFSFLSCLIFSDRKLIGRMKSEEPKYYYTSNVN